MLGNRAISNRIPSQVMRATEQLVDDSSLHSFDRPVQVNRKLNLTRIVGLFVTYTLFSTCATDAADKSIDFSRDIRSILSENCFSCHGPDEKSRAGGLRLDSIDAIKSKSDSGKTAIVPGSVTESELIRRILTQDESELMPPKESGKKLTAAQKELLRRWVAEGADFQQHWAFIAPNRSKISEPGLAGSNGPIDDFIRDRLKREGLSPSPEANKEQLIRRISLDLTGTPPTIDEVNEFLADKSPDAFEKVVDRLLASPRYGERVALDWLDAARFADTHGFNNDTARPMWRWRDWTIDSFNANKPFDQFVTDQLAGDLLPNPSLEQLIATGFNRNHVINSEGGIIAEEYRVEYVADRVTTTSTVLLGLSVGCARCHDHKYDPITQREFYQFFAFFNQLDEKGEAGRRGNAEPFIQAPTPDQAVRKSRLTRELESLDQEIQQQIVRRGETISEWQERLRTAIQPGPNDPTPLIRLPLNETTGEDVIDQRNPERKARIVGKTERVPGKLDGAIKLDGNTHVEIGDVASFDQTDKFSFGAWVKVENKDAATIISRMDDAADYRGFDLQLDRGKMTAHFISKWPDDCLQVITKVDVSVNEWKHVFVTYDGSSKAEGLKLYVDGKQQEVEIKYNNLKSTTVTSKTLRVGRRTDGAAFKGLIDEVRVYDRELTADEVRSISSYDGIADLLAIAPEQRNPAQIQIIAKAELLRFDTNFQAKSNRSVDLKSQLQELEKVIPTTMVMREMSPPRKTFLLKRGQYDAPTDEVQPDVPASLSAFPSDAPRNRLGLAKWFLSPRHPLTSRVAVNRSWALFFGSGLVETVEDFGSQGQWPSHVELLDWLAVEFSGSDLSENAQDSTRPKWDLKRLHRSMLTSATYRQSSRISPELRERDPANKLLARGPRFRLQAEMIRDNALAIAGLLSDHLGGPSVSPYQPAGLWDDVAVGADYDGTVYKQDKGEGLYRRSMYTFWKRTCPPPGMNTFDAPEREFCLARRSRTNTPLQALVLLNDPTYLEAARILAERAIKSGGASLPEQLTYAFRLSVSRNPTTAELDALTKTYEKRLRHYQQAPAAAKSFLSIGEAPRDESINEAELAAWTTVMSLILNLDEVVTKG